MPFTCRQQVHPTPPLHTHAHTHRLALEQLHPVGGNFQNKEGTEGDRSLGKRYTVPQLPTPAAHPRPKETCVMFASLPNQPRSADQGRGRTPVHHSDLPPPTLECLSPLIVLSRSSSSLLSRRISSSLVRTPFSKSVFRLFRNIISSLFFKRRSLRF